MRELLPLYTLIWTIVSCCKIWINRMAVNIKFTTWQCCHVVHLFILSPGKLEIPCTCTWPLFCLFQLTEKNYKLFYFVSKLGSGCVVSLFWMLFFGSNLQITLITVPNKNFRGKPVILLSPTNSTSPLYAYIIYSYRRRLVYKICSWFTNKCI